MQWQNVSYERGGGVGGSAGRGGPAGPAGDAPGPAGPAGVAARVSSAISYVRPSKMSPWPATTALVSARKRTRPEFRLHHTQRRFGKNAPLSHKTGHSIAHDTSQRQRSAERVPYPWCPSCATRTRGQAQGTLVTTRPTEPELLVARGRTNNVESQSLHTTHTSCPFPK